MLVNKTPEQCRDHFERVYVENTSGDFADDWKLGEGISAGARRSDIIHTNDRSLVHCKINLIATYLAVQISP